MTEADVGSVWWHVAWDTGTGRFCAVPTALTLRSIGSFRFPAEPDFTDLRLYTGGCLRVSSVNTRRACPQMGGQPE